MKKLHIIQVSSYYPPHLGGQENAVESLAIQLADSGHDVQVITSTQGGGKPGTNTEKNIRISRLRGFVFGHAPIMPFFPLKLFFAARRNSIVHLHIGQAFTPEMVWLVSKLRGFKYVAQLHIDFEPSGPAGFLLPLYKKTLLKRALRGASQVIVLNEKTRQIVKDKYGCNAEIISNGIDAAFFTAKRKPFSATPPKTLRLLFVGRLSKQKNIGVLLDALKNIKHNVHLDLIGEGDEAELVKQKIASTKLRSKVTFHGRLPRQKVMEFYKTSHALIMPSLYEAQPLVLLEAMAAQIPIIGTNVIGVGEHIKNIGVITEPTVAGVQNGIDQYFTLYPRLPSMVKRGHKKAAALGWPHILKKYERLYESLLDR